MSNDTCAWDDCPEPRKKREWCDKHYRRLLKSGAIERLPKGGNCAYQDCPKAAISRGYCRVHYRRFMNHGDPGIKLTNKGLSPEERLWKYVDKDGPIPLWAPELGPCWIWLKSTTADGYGAFSHLGDDGKNHNTTSHKFAYEITVGPVLDGLVLDHLCRVVICCNPSHLDPVPPAVNTQRGFASRDGRRSNNHQSPTHCPQGHPYDDQNLCVTKNGHRSCRECNRISGRASHAKKRLAEGVIITPRPTTRAASVTPDPTFVYSPPRPNAITLANRNHWICGICNTAIDPTLSYPDSGYRSIDHIIPRSIGGADTYENTRIAHLACNLERRKQSVSEADMDLLLSLSPDGSAAWATVAFN